MSASVIFTPSEQLREVSERQVEHSAKSHARVASVGAIHLKPTVLILDDSRSIHALIKSSFEKDKLRFISAYDGMSGLARAESAKPDLILLDVDLPDINGFFVCRHLKTNPITSSIPVIFLTASSSADEMICGLELRAVDYLTKPFEEEVLRERRLAALRQLRLAEGLWPHDTMSGMESTSGHKRWRAHAHGARSRPKENPWNHVNLILQKSIRKLRMDRSKLSNEPKT